MTTGLISQFIVPGSGLVPGRMAGSSIPSAGTVRRPGGALQDSVLLSNNALNVLQQEDLQQEVVYFGLDLFNLLPAQGNGTGKKTRNRRLRQKQNEPAWLPAEPDGADMAEIATFIEELLAGEDPPAKNL